MCRNITKYNEMFYRCFTKENDGVKHFWIFGLETRNL